jgi:hypothetical protein
LLQLFQRYGGFFPYCASSLANSIKPERSGFKDKFPVPQERDVYRWVASIEFNPLVRIV